MAAWMALNLSLQDQFWSLNAQEVKLAVSGVVDMLNDFHEQGSPGETRRRLSNPLLGRFRHHTTQFRLLISELLAPSALTVVKSLILESLAGFYEHALWCNKVGGDASSYLAIKRKISGLSPLFYLVHISTPGATSAWSSTLRTMQNLVSTAAVLQKELVEVEAALPDESLTNYVLNTAAPQVRALPLEIQLTCLNPSVRSTISRHNKIVHDITDHYRHIHFSSKLRHEQESASLLVAFLGRHLEWKARSMHYQTRIGLAEDQQSNEICALPTLRKILQDLE